MNDQQLIELIAKIWVGNGGDEEGIDYCYNKIKDAVREALGKGATEV